ncbi:MAG: hypothetical protein BJ554DRAFT_800, partial [Olpidium bornovanus]
YNREYPSFPASGWLKAAPHGPNAEAADRAAASREAAGRIFCMFGGFTEDETRRAELVNIPTAVDGPPFIPRAASGTDAANRVMQAGGYGTSARPGLALATQAKKVVPPRSQSPLHTPPPPLPFFCCGRPSRTFVGFFTRTLGGASECAAVFTFCFVFRGKQIVADMGHFGHRYGSLDCAWETAEPPE